MTLVCTQTPPPLPSPPNLPSFPQLSIPWASPVLLVFTARAGGTAGLDAAKASTALPAPFSLKPARLTLATTALVSIPPLRTLRRLPASSVRVTITAWVVVRKRNYVPTMPLRHLLVLRLLLAAPNAPHPLGKHATMRFPMHLGLPFTNSALLESTVLGELQSNALSTPSTPLKALRRVQRACHALL